MSKEQPMILMKRNFFTDEQGNLSMARLLVATWTIYLMLMWWLLPGVMTEHEISAALSMLLALIGWAGGARVMQYIAPSIQTAASGVIKKFGKPASEKEIAEIEAEQIEDVTKTTDVQELANATEKG
jgi:hypothetical protein